MKMSESTSLFDCHVPIWATEWGVDRYGIFASFSVAGMEQRMRWIPPGQFMMGSPESEVGRWKEEGPQHPVVLTQGFWLGEVPVRQALWRAVMGNDPSMSAGDDIPIQASWDDCRYFIENVNDVRTGLSLRFPREHEWEYACRASTAGPSWLGANTNSTLSRIAWYVENCRRLRPVGTKEANPWGLYDMLGNVWEWCEDWYAPYTAAPVVDPPLPESGSMRVVRGGGYEDSAHNLRAACRAGDLSSDWYTGGRAGLRLAASR